MTGAFRWGQVAKNWPLQRSRQAGGAQRLVLTGTKKDYFDKYFRATMNIAVIY